MQILSQCSLAHFWVHLIAQNAKRQALPQDDGTTITTLLRDVREAAISLKRVTHNDASCSMCRSKPGDLFCWMCYGLGGIGV